MRRKHVLSLLMLSTGVALLVAATTVGVASAKTHVASSKSALRGGTLRVNQSFGDFDNLDPGIAYVTNDWELLYSVQSNLVNYPEKNGAAGNQLYPEDAVSFPAISKNGKTYTFHLRKGLKFSDGSKLNAKAFQRAWERSLSSKMNQGSPIANNDHFEQLIVGAPAFQAGHASHISGIKAHGLTITFHLTKSAPFFMPALAMQWFGAVKPNMAYSSTGIQKFPSAGPYFIATRNVASGVTILKRNPFYKGHRPANPTTIVVTSNTDGDTSMTQIQANQADLDIAGVPGYDAATFGQKYGVNKKRFWAEPTNCIEYIALNSAKAPTNNIKVRKALEYILDRTGILQIQGKYAGIRSDQLLTPPIPGYKQYKIYPNGSNYTKGKQVGGAALTSAGSFEVAHSTSHTRTVQAQLMESEMHHAGLKTSDNPIPGTQYYSTIDTRGSSYNLARAGWCADYNDPSNYINTLYDGRTLQPTGNADLTFTNNGKLNKKMDAANKKSGKARVKAYAALDRWIMVNVAPVVPYDIINARYLVSAKVKNWTYSEYFGAPALNALAVG